MNNMHIRFVTFFPKCHNLGLTKDVGQIPNTLGKNYNIDAKLVSCIVDENDESLKELTGMTIEKIPYIFRNDFITGCIYILRNAKRVDWFNFYHGGRRVYFWTKLYKKLNKNGKVYLKMDMGYKGCDELKNNERKLRIFNKNVRAVDLISVETDAVRRKVNEITDADLKLICDGYYDAGDINIKPLSDRRKEFITVGRLGSPEKNTEMLLESFAESANNHDWNLRLIGPLDDNFVSFKEDFMNSHPSLRNRIIFNGPIFNKKKLYGFYNSARVFVLPSLWESFSLAGAEASHCGCRMILSDAIPSFKELTNNGRYGERVETGQKKKLTEALISEASFEIDKDEPLEISDYADKNLSWKQICEKLYGYMKKCSDY